MCLKGKELKKRFLSITVNTNSNLDRTKSWNVWVFEMLNVKKIENNYRYKLDELSVRILLFIFYTPKKVRYITSFRTKLVF